MPGWRKGKVMNSRGWIKGIVVIGVMGLCGCRLEPSIECDQLPADRQTGNAGCLVQREGALLMVQQRIDGRWALPGGTAESGERAACTAARETREETGLPVQVVAYLKTLDNGFHLYVCEVPAAAVMQSQDALEILAVDWVGRPERDSLPMRFPDQQRQVERLLQTLP